MDAEREVAFLEASCFAQENGGGHLWGAYGAGRALMGCLWGTYGAERALKGRLWDWEGAYGAFMGLEGHLGGT